MVHNLVENSNTIFKNLKCKGPITENELKHFSPIFTRNLATLEECTSYLKIQERLLNVPGRPVILNCGPPTEKVSEFLEFHLKPILQNCKSNIKDSIDFINKIKSMHSLPKNAILLTADVVGLYPSTSHGAGLKAPRETLEERDLQKILTNDLVKIAEFAIKSNFSSLIVRSGSTYRLLPYVLSILPIRIYIYG